MKKIIAVVALLLSVCSISFACNSFDECMDKISADRGNIPYAKIEAYSAKAQAYAIREIADYIKMDNSQTCYELDANDNWKKESCK